VIEIGSAEIFQTHNLKAAGSNPAPATNFPNEIKAAVSQTGGFLIQNVLAHF